MSNLWERFDGIAKPEEVASAKAQYEPIEPGNYECTLEEITPSESQQGLPMIKGKFRVVETGRIIFYNQMLQNLSNPQMTAVNIAEAVTFIGNLTGEDIEYEGLAKFADTISAIEVGTMHNINVSYGKKDTEMKFPKLKVLKDNVVPFDEDTPFA